MFNTLVFTGFGFWKYYYDHTSIRLCKSYISILLTKNVSMDIGLRGWRYSRGFPCQGTGKENLWCPE